MHVIQSGASISVSATPGIEYPGTKTPVGIGVGSMVGFGMGVDVGAMVEVGVGDATMVTICGVGLAVGLTHPQSATPSTSKTLSVTVNCFISISPFILLET